MGFTTMHPDHRTLRDKVAGFTLVEVLAIAPVVILVIGTFIAFMVILTGDTLVSNARNQSVYEAQRLKARLLEDVQFSVSYEPLSFASISTPLGSNLGTARFNLDPDPDGNGVNSTLSAILILKVPARTKPAVDPTRAVVYSNSPNTCGSADENKNDPYYINIIYYLRDNGDSTYGLWRRVIYNPGQTACGAGVDGPTNVSEKQSCAPESMSSYPSACKAEDIKVVDKMSWPTFYFADTPDATVEDNPNTTGDETLLDCIRRCYESAGTPGTYADNIFQTYSDDTASGVNAYSYSLSYTTSESVRGVTTSTKHTIYASRS